MKKREIKSKVKNYIKEGLSKQQIFQRLGENLPFKTQKKIASILKFTPSLKQKKQYKTIQICLIILVGIVTIYNGVTFINYTKFPYTHWFKSLLLFPDLELILLFGLLTYKGRYYRYAILLICILILEGIREVFELPFNAFHLVAGMVYTSILGLSIYLHQKMTSKFEIVQQENDSNPELKSIFFKD